jgi:hypothetical protein
MMEQEIMHIVEEYQQSTTATPTHMYKIDEILCTYCNKDPCLWVASKEAMLQFGKSEHVLLTGDGIPSANLCRKKGIYCQTELIIAVGVPTGRGIGACNFLFA